MTNHLIVSCHFGDGEDLDRVVAGMEVHSDFFAFNMVTPFAENGWERAYPLPLVAAYQACVPQSFAHDTLAGLLHSVPWKRPKWVRVIVTETAEDMEAPAWRAYSISEYLLYAMTERGRSHAKG
jgi:hypothetical protein